METLRSDRSVLEAIADFDPARIAGLSPASPLTIRSLALITVSDAQTLIYIGTGGGKILLLSLDRSSSPAAVKFLRSTSLTNRPIDPIIVLVEIGRILAISDGVLFLLDSQLLHPPRKLSCVKDVTAVAKQLPSPNPSSSSDEAEAVKSRQRFLSKLSGVNGTQSRISCSIAVAAGKRLAVIELVAPAITSDVNSDLGGVSVVLKEIQGVDGVRAMAWVGDSIIVGSPDGYMIFSVGTGKGTPIFSFPESSGTPRLKSLWRSSEVLLLVDNVGVVVNALGQPVGGSLVFQYVPQSIAEMSSCVVVAGDGRLDVYRKKTAACLHSVSFAKGSTGPFIVADDNQGNGEVLVVTTPYKGICYRQVSAEEQIKDLLRKKNFKEAICLAEEFESEGEMTKELLYFVHAQVGFLLLFDLHFEDAVNHFLLSVAMQPSEIFPFIMRDPNRWSHLVPRNRYWGLHPPPVPLEEVVDDGLIAIQRAAFLRKAGVNTAANEDFLSNPPSRAYLLESAITSIIRYLCVSRERDLITPVKEGVDTLLMYLYRALNRVDDMEQLASSPNNCVVEELETLLYDSGHLRTLAFLYASKGMSSKALAIWRILARNYSTRLWKDPATSVERDSLGSSMESISSQNAAAFEASKLLQESSDQNLVLEHLGWIANIDQELAVIVLTSEKRVNHLSPELVLAAVDPKKAEIRERYLQWLIEDQDSNVTQFHTLYALSLAKSAIGTIEMGNYNEANSIERSDDMSTSDVGSAMQRYPVRERLQLFLQASDLYDPEEVLDVIEESELWLEKAILYRKMGQETLVLQILALKLEDVEAAEQYCAEIGRHDAYMQLLEMYLEPQDGKEPMFKAAVRLLHNHGESLDPLQVLEKLSPEMPLQLAANTILRMLRARLHHHYQGQIVRNVSHATSVDARLARMEERSRQVQINEESSCDSCHARLGTKLFAMYPDDSVVCYKCYRRQGESRSVSGRDFKQEPIFKPGWLVTR